DSDRGGQPILLPDSTGLEPSFFRLSQQEQRERVQKLRDELGKKLLNSLEPNAMFFYEHLTSFLRFRDLSPGAQYAILMAIKNHPNARAIDRLWDLHWCNWFVEQTPEDQMRSAKFIASYATKTRDQDSTLRDIFKKVLTETVNHPLDPIE